MKVIGLTHNYLSNESGDSFPGVFLMSDSALLKDGKPFFVPSFSKEISLRPAAVIRINRLGKNIAKKFANRYYDAVTVGVCLTAEDLQRDLQTHNLPDDLARSFDGAAILGNFIETSNLSTDISDCKIEIKNNGETIDSFTLNKLRFDIDTIIEYISKFYTLKIGDIIYTGYSDCKYPIEMNQHFTGTINGVIALDFKTK